jgi:hypothetical protein
MYMKITSYSSQILMIRVLKFSRQIFEKCSRINLHDNLSSGSLVVLYGHANTHTRRRTDWLTDRHVANIIAEFRNFENAQKKYIYIFHKSLWLSFDICTGLYSFIVACLSQVHSLFQSEFSTECDLMSLCFIFLFFPNLILVQSKYDQIILKEVPSCRQNV